MTLQLTEVKLTCRYVNTTCCCNLECSHFRCSQNRRT